MNKESISQRLIEWNTVLDMLKEFKKRGIRVGICFCLVTLPGIPYSTKEIYYSDLVLFPELLEHKPKGHRFDGWWWDLDSRGMLIRIRVVKLIINKLKEEIANEN